MTRAQVWLQHVANLLVGGTGLAYFALKHATTSDDPFAVVNHPLQPMAQHLHVLAAPLLVFAAGLATSHALSRLSTARRTGLLMLGGFVPMAASGYLLQVAVEPAWRAAWMWIHLVSGAAWAVGYVVHVVRTARPAAGLQPEVEPAARGTDGGPRTGVLPER